MTKIELKNIYKSYEDGNQVVKDFNLTIDKKEFIIFVGPSGCGKSTTLRMIAGLEDITKGELFIDGELMNKVKPSERDIAMVFQNYALYPHMTVAENIGYSLKIKKVSKAERAQKVQEIAELLHLEKVLHRLPKQLSGGQRQRVAMGRAMVRRPKLFLMDEPLSNLDAKLRNYMRVEIQNIYKMLDTTFIYVTHDQMEAMTLGTRIVVLKDGIIQQIDSPHDLYAKPVNMFVAGFIGTPQMNFVDAKCILKNNSVCLLLNGEEVALPDSKIDLFKFDYAEKDIVIGVRPEHIKVCEDGMFTSVVKVYEMLGSEAYLHVELLGKDMILSVSGNTTIREGDEVSYSFDFEQVHYFDKLTELAIR